MLLFKYKKLFSVEIMHSFYQSMYSNDFSIEPTNECKRLLSKFNFLYKATPYGFVVLAEVHENDNLIKEVTSNLKFTFSISLRNQFLKNFTRIPIEMDGNQFYYFDNKEVNEVNVFNSGSSSLLLNNGDNVTESDLEIIESNLYRYKHSGSEASKTSILHFSDEGISLPPQSVAGFEGTFDFQYDLSCYSPGKCQLEIDSATVDDFYFINGINKKKLFGVIEIFCDVPDENKFLSNPNTINYKEYKIAFINRSTLWRYRLTNKSNVSFSNLDISNAPSTFTLTTSNGFMVFTSENKIPIKETPIQGIKLVDKVNSTTEDLLTNLPNAGIEQIKPEDLNQFNEKIYSDIFIYI